MEVQKRERDEFTVPTAPVRTKRQNIGPYCDLDLSYLDMTFMDHPYNMGLGSCVDLVTLTLADLKPFYFQRETVAEKLEVVTEKLEVATEKPKDPVPPSFQQMTGQITFVFPWIIALGGTHPF